MTSLAHKPCTLPDVDLSHDEGDPSWYAAGGERSTPVLGADGRILHYRWNGLEPGHYASYWQLCVAGPWEEAVRSYEESPGDVFRAWVYADGHPVFWRFSQERHPGYPANHVSRLTFSGALTRGWPEVTPYRVCPETGRREDDGARNTVTAWWYELGPERLLPDEDGCQVPWHDYKLDGSAATYEEAVIALARAIHENYGNDRSVVDSQAWRDGGNP